MFLQLEDEVSSLILGPLLEKYDSNANQCLLFCKVTGISSISERKYQKFRLGRDSVLKPFGIQVWITVWYEVNNMQWSGKVKITKLKARFTILSYFSAR